MSEMKTLPALIREAGDIANLLAESGGEITEDVEALISRHGVELSQKVDAYWFVMNQLESQAAAAKIRADEWNTLAKASARGYDNLKSRILQAMQQLELKEISGGEVLFRRQANPPRVEIEDEKKLPGQYLVTETITKIDKARVLEDLKAGKSVPGARMERGERVVPKPALVKGLR